MLPTLTKPRLARRRGFSLAEMMIALAVLALGLLVIGAALPIGVRYSQDTANLATGEAAADYALDLIEQNATIVAGGILDSTGALDRETGIFVPRGPLNDPNEGNALLDYEPVIKVRPLYVESLEVKSNGDLVPYLGNRSEQMIYYWLIDVGVVPATTHQYDDESWLRPNLSCAATVFPPPKSDGTYLPHHFFGNMYSQWPTDDVLALKKLQTSLITWTAFYRRVSYAPGSDPGLYEVVVVVTRRPSERHRYPMPTDQVTVYDGGGGGITYSTGGAQASAVDLGYDDRDLTTPIPWLVMFDALPRPELGFDDDVPESQSATLEFTIVESKSGLFPVGSVFIPARNDRNPNAVPEADRVGVAPKAPDCLPIYKVVDRPDETTVVTENNGFYPFKYDGSTPDGKEWPVWVIPPAFEEISGNNPVFEDKSSVLAIGRRYMRFHVTP